MSSLGCFKKHSMNHFYLDVITFEFFCQALSFPEKGKDIKNLYKNDKETTKTRIFKGMNIFFEIKDEVQGEREMMNEKVLVRGKSSGVFFGTLAEKEGSEITLKNCRRIWYWKGAASISQLALEGVKNPNECKFTVTVPEIVILDAIEIIPCSPEAILNIEGVKVWKA